VWMCGGGGMREKGLKGNFLILVSVFLG